MHSTRVLVPQACLPWRQRPRPTRTGCAGAAQRAGAAAGRYERPYGALVHSPTARPIVSRLHASPAERARAAALLEGGDEVHAALRHLDDLGQLGVDVPHRLVPPAGHRAPRVTATVLGEYSAECVHTHHGRRTHSRRLSRAGILHLDLGEVCGVKWWLSVQAYSACQAGTALCGMLRNDCRKNGPRTWPMCTGALRRCAQGARACMRTQGALIPTLCARSSTPTRLRRSFSGRSRV